MTTDQQVNTQTPAVDSQASQTQDSFSIPEAYQGKGWVEKIKSTDDLWKTVDANQKLIGSRPAGIPSADAPQADWDKFYQAAGRPESPDKYALSDIDGLPEGVDLTETKQSAMQLMHKAGLTQKQADALWKDYMGLEMGALEKNKVTSEEQKKALDAEFDTITKEHFGGDFETAQKITNEMVSKYVPEALRASFADLADHPKALAAIAALTKGTNAEIERVKKEYGAEGKITSGDQAASQDIVTVRKELAALRTSNEARDFLNPKHKETMNRIQELGGVVDRFYKK